MKKRESEKQIFETQIIHLKTPANGGVTLAVRESEIFDDPNGIDVGAAFCSPTEKQFNKKKGRIIAEGRLAARRNGFLCYCHYGKDDQRCKLTDNSKELLEVLVQVGTRCHRGTGVRGPLWWPGFILSIRRQFGIRRTREERAAGVL